MKTINKIESLYLDLERSEAKGLVEHNIRLVAWLVPLEVELKEKERYLKNLCYSLEAGVLIDMDLMHILRDSIELLKKQIDEGIK
jgi:hypothetical protein